jgi:hypothetical protein
MNLICAIVRLLVRTKYYFLHPKIVIHLLDLISTAQEIMPEVEISDAVKHINEQIVFDKIREETGEHIGEFDFIPDEPGGLVLLKNKENNEWSVVQLPRLIDLKQYSIYARYGNQHTFYPLNEIDIGSIIQTKVLKERIYTSSYEENNTRKAKSIVYENLKEEAFEIPNKNINVTFYRCKDIYISRLQCPVGGIKLVHCRNVNIDIQVLQDDEGNDQLPVIPIYAFYCDTCEIRIHKDYQGTLYTEIHGCLDFNIVRTS